MTPKLAAGIYLAAVLEYLSCEVLELAGDAAHENHKKRINPRHLNKGNFEKFKHSKILNI
jgi:hypothetical protein